VTLIASVIILNENLTVLRLLGAVIIIGGIYLSRSSTIVSAPELEEPVPAEEPEAVVIEA
jgi:hypothetical protein